MNASPRRMTVSASGVAGKGREGGHAHTRTHPLCTSPVQLAEHWASAELLPDWDLMSPEPRPPPPPASQRASERLSVPAFRFLTAPRRSRRSAPFPPGARWTCLQCQMVRTLCNFRVCDCEHWNAVGVVVRGCMTTGVRVFMMVEF